MILGAALGLLFGFGVAVMLDRTDRRVREPHEIGDLFDRPVLGLVPESRNLGKSTLGFGDLSPPEADSFRSIRANLKYFNVEREVSAVLITSPLPGDGKSTVAWNLAAAAASVGERALLIEADLRRPRLAQSIAGPVRGGLSEVLSGQTPLSEALVDVPIAASANGSSPPSVMVLFAGSLPPNPSDLIESERMGDLIEAARNHYDLVVVDSPPTSLIADAVPLVSQVDGVIVVVRVASTSLHAAERLKVQLDHLGAATLGVVVNAISTRSLGYGRGYYGDSSAVKRPSGGLKRRLTRT